MTQLAGQAILFVHPSDELYGADRCLLDLVRGLPDTTRTVVVLPQDVAYAGALSRELADAGAEVHRVDFAVLRRGGLRPANWPGLLRRLVLGTREIARLARERDVAIIHTNTLAAVSGPFAALFGRRRHVWHVHEVIADERLVVRIAYRLLLLLPGRVIANSQATALALAGPLPALRRKTSVVYPGVTCTQASERHASDGPLRVGYVGRLAPRKGIGELLEAVALVRARGVDMRLDVYGSAPPGQEWREGQYRRRAIGLGLAESVHFHGFVADIQNRLGGIDVLVAPSQRPEPFGLVIIEAMAAGCAVVVSRNDGGSDEIVEHGRTGLFCGRNAEPLAHAIERLARDVELREGLGARARTEVAERFGVERYVRGVLEVYEDKFINPVIPSGVKRRRGI